MLAKAYNHNDVENSIYQLWEKNNCFSPEQASPDAEPYCIIMPPPNTTGRLHMGHATYVIQDILIRYHRMRGYAALYLPGTDHASIATQAVVEKKLASEGLDRQTMGREKFLEAVWKWTEDYGGAITQQLRSLGMSCDWTRERFTMDEQSSRAVLEAFVQLYNKGLIYQDNYIVNWSPGCQTVIADDEVIHEQRQSNLWHLVYPLADGTGSLVVATTRPETMLGDTAVAVHPDDERYQSFIGKTLRLPLVDREIPVIADQHVDPAFGSGAVKVTPAHDPNDFAMGKRHNLPVIQVIGFDDTMSEDAGKFAGMPVLEARDAVIKALKEVDALEKIIPYEHSVGICYRSNTIVQPMVSRQWFVKAQILAQDAMAAVRDGRITFVPKRFEKVYFQWMENIHDWCISRQLWWGHRIPVYYSDDGDVIVSMTDPSTDPKYKGKKFTQDEDVLDTWFSSGLWPFSTLGWPSDQASDLQHYFPTSVLETGYDIIFFWIARMIMLSLACTGEVPFHTVYFHGLVRDEQGIKMSKSLGNALDPLDIIEQYGADALRYSLVAAISPGNDLNFSLSKTEGYRHFANKLWNASRFVMSNLAEEQQENLSTASREAVGKPLVTDERFSNWQPITLPQRWIVSRLHQVTQHVDKAFSKYHLSDIALTLYDFTWHDVCDWYLESAKVSLQDSDPAVVAGERTTMLYVLTCLLKLLHPFMPFVTEKIWQELRDHHAVRSIAGELEPYLITTPWSTGGSIDKKAIINFDESRELITALRTLRAEFSLAPGDILDAVLVGEGELSPAEHAILERLGRLRELAVQAPGTTPPQRSLKVVVGRWELYLCVGKEFDTKTEIARIERELEELEKRRKGLEAQLANPAFVDKAPENVVAERRESLEAVITACEKLGEQKKVLRGMVD